jgi:hypothetical protein
MTGFMADGELLVVETDDDAYIGTVEVVGDALVVRSGYVGRPWVVPRHEVCEITSAADHPLVEQA